MRAVPIVVLLSVGCGGGSSQVETEQEREVKAAFEAWVKKVADGDGEAVYRGMSSRMISDWLFARLADPQDLWTQEQRKRLKGRANEELEIWFLRNQGRKEDRPSTLPASVLTSRWLFDLFQAYFRVAKARLKMEFGRLEVVLVAVDSLGATVLARNRAYGGTDQYVLVHEGGWKIDRHKEPLNVRPK